MKVRILVTILLAFGIAASCQQTVELPGGQKLKRKPITGNQAPTANAGVDQTLSSGTTSATLSGSGTDSDGTITTYSWTQTFGAAATITSPSSASTTVTGLSEGTYTFQLTVTDNSGATDVDEVSITVASSLTDTLDLYISAGQSNMDGRAVDPLPYADAQNVVPGVKVWVWGVVGNTAAHRTFQNFEYDRYNGGQAPSTPKWAGDIIVMKKLYDSLKTPNVVYLMKATWGGTSLGPLNRTGNWIIPQDSVYPGAMRIYDTLVKRLNDVRSWAAAQGKYVRVKAVMWHQGESDEGDLDAEAAYQYRLERVFNAIRTEVGNPNLPIVMGTVSSASIDYSATIHTAMVNVANADPNIYLIELDGQNLFSDNLHFSNPGQTYFGDQMYQIIKNL